MTSKCRRRSQVAIGILFPALAASVTQAKPHFHATHSVRTAISAREQALEAQVQALSQEVSELKGWHDAETARQAQADNQVAALRAQVAQAQARADALQTSADAQIKTLPEQVRAEVAAEQPKDGKVRYHGVKLTLGGFAAAESVARTKNETADIGSSFSKIPFANAPLAHVGELRGTARQSRLSLLAEGDVNETTHAAFYSEFDFLAGAQTGNSNESNSFSPRIRNVYGTLDFDNLGLHFLTGQNWSLATLNTKGITPRNEAPPPTIDAQYVVGFSWSRQPQVRVTADFADKQVWAAFSVENPQSTFAGAATGVTGTVVPGVTVTDNGVPTSQFDSANTLSLNRLPDIVGKVAFEPDLFGGRPLHLEAYGLYREFYDRVNVTSASNLLALPVGVGNKATDAGGFGWGATWTLAPIRLDLMTSGLVGRGIGRYGSSQLPDSAVGPDGRLKPIPEVMLLVGATEHVTPALDLYVYAGEERERPVYSLVNGSTYGFGAPTANLAGCSVEGATCSPNIRRVSQITGGLWDKFYQGKFGSLRIGLQYSYTQLEAFPGVGGANPKTNDQMIFTSFRYYPF